MKRSFSILGALVILCALADAQPQLQGPLSGSLGPGTYQVVGPISVSSGNTLNIQPGTTLLFRGLYKFIVNGSLQAIGTVTDSIKFVPYNSTTRWAGLRLNSVSHLEYCRVSGSDSSGILCTSSSIISHCTISENYAPYRGGGIFVGTWNSAATISYCTISDNRAHYSGGGITADAPSLITHCLITRNSTEHEGGGIEVNQSEPTISYCTITDNEALGGGDCGGGGIMAYKGFPVLSYCRITHNIASRLGGGVLLSDASMDMDNCTISDNTAALGGGIYFEVYDTYFASNVTNTIVEGNSGDYGVYFDYGSYTCCSLNYCNFYNHQIANFYHPPAGVGTLAGVNVNGDSCDVFHNIFENPLFADPGNGNYLLTWAHYPLHDSTMSPCIDAGDPATPFDPDSTIADMGAYYFPQTLTPQLDVTITPEIIIPPPQEYFIFRASVVNNGPFQAPFWVWARIRFPNGIWTTPTVGPLQINPPVGITISRRRTQNVPSTWPAGMYYYVDYANWTYSYPAIDSSYFTFVKTTPASGGLFEPAPYSQGEPFPGEVMPVAIPATSAMCSVSPNPFNATTTIRYQLSTFSPVSLTVYDTAGRLITTLVEGWREAGNHQVTFDGSALSSGMYLYTLKTEMKLVSGKMILLK